MYKYFISLGGNCTIACSLNKYGLRGFAGPFDWMTSKMEGIVQCIENRENDLLREIDIIPEYGRTCNFYNKKYQMIFPDEIGFHDFDDPRYRVIKNKYYIRMNRFYEKMKEPCCLIRRVMDEEDIAYINRNYSKICKIITSAPFNSHNKIIYLINESNLSSDIKFEYFEIKEKGEYYYSYMTESIEGNQLLLDWCIDNINPEERLKNLQFSLLSYIDKAQMHRLQYNISFGLEDVDVESLCGYNSIGIWGAGRLGEKLKQILTERSIDVECFIDRMNIRGGENPYINKKELFNRFDCIIITPIWDKESIVKMLENYKGKIIFVDDLIRNFKR